MVSSRGRNRDDAQLTEREPAGLELCLFAGGGGGGKLLTFYPTHV